MELTFIDVKNEYRSILFEILDELDIKQINQMVKCRNPYEITFGASIVFETKDIEVDTSYEKFEYAKYLLIKKIKEAEKRNKKLKKDVKHLEKCLEMSNKKKKKSAAKVEVSFSENKIDPFGIFTISQFKKRE